MQNLRHGLGVHPAENDDSGHDHRRHSEPHYLSTENKSVHHLYNCHHLPIYSEDRAEVHLHLLDVGEELVDPVDVADQDHLDEGEEEEGGAAAAVKHLGPTSV